MKDIGRMLLRVLFYLAVLVAVYVVGYGLFRLLSVSH